jgi:periplasmic protein TonB
METKKNRSKNLDNKKTLFFQIGLIITLIGVFYAFQWKLHERVIPDIDQGRMLQHDIEIIELVIPERPKPLPIPELTELILTKEEIPDEIDINLDVDNVRNVSIPFPEIIPMPDEEPVEDPIIAVPEFMPEFPGGPEALFRYFRQNLKYPAQELQLGISGTVYVGFVVEKDGSISHVHVSRGVSPGLNEEAMRVVRNMPNWIPGRMGIHPVRASYTVPISFRVQR